MRTRVLRFALALAAIILLAGSGLLAYGEWYFADTEALQREVWADYLNHDLEAWMQPPKGLVAAIENRTGVYGWIDRARRPKTLETGTYVRFLLGNLRSHKITPPLRIHAHYELATPGAVERIQNSPGFWVLSAVGFNSDRTQALLIVDHVCGLCGHGDTLILRKVRGHWTLIDATSRWVS